MCMFNANCFRKEKEKEMLDEILNKVDEILTNVSSSLQCSSDADQTMKTLKNHLASYMRRCTSANDFFLSLPLSKEVSVQEVVTCQLEEKNIGKAISERVKHGDLDGADFEFVRVEAITCKILDFRTHHIPYVVHVPRDYIYILNEGHLRFIENGVLNLNMLPEIEGVGDLFNLFLDDFIGFEPEENAKLPPMLNFPPNFPRDPRHYYTIKTNDQKTCTFPKILFEIHSDGYNAMRVRDAERTGSDPSEFELNASLETLENLKVVLMDTRTLQSYNDEQLLNLLDVCRYCLFNTHLPAIINKIVLTAKEESPEALQDVFYCHPEEAIKLVVQHRLDIIFTWKKLPMPPNYIRVLDAIVKEIQSQHYKLTRITSPEQIPLELTENQNFTDYPPNEVIAQVLMIDEKDPEVLEDFLKSFTIWNETIVKPNLKRKLTHN